MLYNITRFELGFRKSVRDGSLQGSLKLKRQGSVVFNDSGLDQGLCAKCSFHITVLQNFRVAQASIKSNTVGVGEKVRLL